MDVTVEKLAKDLGHLIEQEVGPEIEKPLLRNYSENSASSSVQT